MLRRVLLLAAYLLIATPVLADDVSIVIDLSEQHMRVSVGGMPTYSFDVSTGRKGYSTPKGTYGVQRMYKEYYSKKYDWAPMPYSIFSAAVMPSTALTRPNAWVASPRMAAFASRRRTRGSSTTWSRNTARGTCASASRPRLPRLRSRQHIPAASDEEGEDQEVQP